MIIQFDVEDLHHIVGLGPVEAVIFLDPEGTLHDVGGVAGGQQAGALCALSLVADYSSDSGQE